jgi:hypothetical protein
MKHKQIDPFSRTGDRNYSKNQSASIAIPAAMDIVLFTIKPYVFICLERNLFDDFSGFFC